MKTPKPETDDAKTQNAKNLLVLGFWRPKTPKPKGVRDCGVSKSGKVGFGRHIQQNSVVKGCGHGSKQ